MGFKQKYFDPNWYYYKVIALCILMCIDIVFNSFTQFLDFGSTNIMTKYNISNYEKDSSDISFGVFAIQFIIQIFIIFTLLSIFSQTFFFKFGLLKITCGQFKFTFIVIFIYPILFLLERAIRAFYLSSKDIELNELTIWSTGYYIAAYVLKYIFAFLFYIVTLNSSYELGKSKYYKADPNFGKT